MAINVADRKSLRLISHSEIETLDTCPKKHDLQYAGQLLGHTLRPKTAAPILRDGRAWGAMVAAWHQTGDRAVAELEMIKLLSEDAKQMADAGIPQADIDEQLAEQHEFLGAVLDDYIREHEMPTLDPAVAGRIHGDRPEHQLLVPIPSRSGKGDSNRYVYDARIDLVFTDPRGLDWIIEFKLRGQLTNYKLLRRTPQFRRYAWAWKRETGRDIAGVIVDERLKDLPKPPRMVRSKTITDKQKEYREACKAHGDEVDKEVDDNLRMVPSTAKDQKCLAHEYEAVCRQGGFEIDEEALAAYAARKWQQRVPIFLNNKALEIVGQQMTGAGADIHAADTGAAYPREKPSQMNCGGCPFDEICDDIHNTEFVDHYFNRRPPKSQMVVEKTPDQAAA